MRRSQAVGRYMLQEMVGKVIPKFEQKKWLPGILLTSLVFTGAWGYLVYTGDIATIWPLFGMSNQLLATCALIVSTTMLIRIGKARYAWITGLSAVLMLLTALVFAEAFWKWMQLLKVALPVKDKYGDLVLQEVEE